MSNRVLGIVNIEPSYVHVEGIENYRPVSATNIFGRYRIIDFILSNQSYLLNLENYKYYLFRVCFLRILVPYAQREYL